MSERITRAALDVRAENLNHRLAGTGRTVQVQGRNGYIALDEYRAPSSYAPWRERAMVRTITVGTKREVADYLTAMMVGIDLARS